MQRKAKKSEAREAYMRKANYAKIKESYGTRYPIADPEQIKNDDAIIEAILTTHSGNCSLKNVHNGQILGYTPQYPENDKKRSHDIFHMKEDSNLDSDLMAAQQASDFMLDDDDADDYDPPHTQKGIQLG